MNINSEIRDNIYAETRNIVNDIARCLKVMTKKDIFLRQKMIAYNRLHCILLPQLKQLKEEINTISD